MRRSERKKQNFSKLKSHRLLFLVCFLTSCHSGKSRKEIIANTPETSPTAPISVTYPTSLDACPDFAWGGPGDSDKIQQAMVKGGEADVKAAILTATKNRVQYLGCPQKAVTFAKATNFQLPNVAEVQLKWRTTVDSGLARLSNGCPSFGRASGLVGLSLLYGRLAGEQQDLAASEQLATNLIATQYSADTSTLPLVATAGAFGYLVSSPNPQCTLGGAAGEGSTRVCSDPVLSKYCVTYSSGQYSGSKFLTADIFPESNIYDGGMAYDQGYSGWFLLESALQADSVAKATFMNSLQKAADWASKEPPVVNHNYTAKLAWLLAGAFNLTGSPQLKAALNDKLNRNLKLGMLMDLNNDGEVDGIAGLKFSSLGLLAQRPGRFWDAHNTLGSYHSKNAWALVESYVSMRDQGDAVGAAELKPYVEAALDNLAWEVNNLGMESYGSSTLLYSLLLAEWKIISVENWNKPEWEKAINAVWFLRKDLDSGDDALSWALLLIHLRGVHYVPPFQR